MSEIFGEAGRVGYVAPSTCERLAREFYRVVPEKLGLLIASLPISRIRQDHVDRALSGIEAAATQLVDTGADAVFSAGLPLVLAGGGESFDTELRDRLEQVTGRPCATDLGTALAALRHLGLDNVLLVTPFTSTVTEQIGQALQQAGVGIAGQYGMDCDRQSQYGRLPTSAPADLVRRVLPDHPGAKAIYIPCGRIGDVQQISAMEAEFGLPVVTANQLVLWWALRWAGLAPAVADCGRLMNELVGAVSNRQQESPATYGGTPS